jgi:O-antigen ligase
LIFVLGGAVSALISGARNLGILEVALMSQLILLSGFVAGIVRQDREHAESVLRISVFAGAALCGLKFWVTYIQYAVEGKAFSWVSPFLEFANVRFFSQYQAYTLFLVVLPMSMVQFGKGWRLLFFLVAANFWALHWMVGTRAAWLGFFVALAVVLAFMPAGRLAWLRWHAAAMLAGGLVYLAFSTFIDARGDTAPVPGMTSIVQRNDDSINERLVLARIAVGAVKNHPLFGVGPGQFGRQPYPVNAAHPHNVPLQLLSEYGLVAGAAGVWLLILLGVFAVKTLRISPPGAGDAVGVTIVAALLMGLTDSLFSGNLTMPQSQVLCCVLAGWIAGRSIPASRPFYTAGRPYRTQKLAIVAAALIAVTITTVLGLEYLPLARDLPVWLPRWNPHFWQYGRFSSW